MNFPSQLPEQLSLWEPPISADLPRLVAGVDEVGRGCLFGPVVGAAVIIPAQIEADLVAAGVKDSKQLGSVQRCRLAQLIREVAIDCKIGIASVAEIDRLNILQASLLAMKRAIVKLKVQPELCLIDGNQRIPGLPVPQQTMVRGDSLSVSIAAASIVAKVWRDELIVRLAAKYPAYDLTSNKGYGTKKHLLALQCYGATRLHRLSFSPCGARDETENF
ncbi:ribonuclease HII [Microcoleus sp. FACHB-68]|uniref:ribonuclease HII n=1 Tax=Microcoleus sp. FACHB-68 TaxID=2692826 RepID=UPI001683F88F|nr:ribonuclease HII [Microcoleus sp. FACHB-68]MBD1938047.1 ribonuclease HII [Microcoleus sp. FACHB-68]